MTNPAVEALKPCPFCGSTHLSDSYVYVRCDMCGANGPEMNGGRNDDHADWVDHERAIAAWNRRAQAEQTPVAGRVVSEELWAYLIEYCEASQPLVALCTKSGETPRLLKNLEALRTAPTVAAMSTGRVIGEELVSKIDDFLTDCEVGFHGYGPEEPKTLATAILKELRAQPSETVRREGE